MLPFKEPFCWLSKGSILAPKALGLRKAIRGHIAGPDMAEWVRQKNMRIHTKMRIPEEFK